MALTLLRHAPPPPAYQRRYLGHTDIAIDPACFEPIRLPRAYDTIYSSDLSRCTQTLEALGYVDFRTDDRLREVRFKDRFEGKSFGEIERMEEYDPSALESHERWHAFVCDESIDAFRGRIGAFLSELPADREILVCTHGGVIREILSQLLGSSGEVDYLEYTIVSLK